MPEKLDRCVNDVKAEGKSEDSAYAICNSSIEADIKEQILETQIKDCSGVSCGCKK